ncbi:MAG: hypothetical protein JXQ23_04205 [Clostridia bacterium]|nr:hypothetical protein [Clostridia bacterium]
MKQNKKMESSDFSLLFTKWCHLIKTAKVIIVTDQDRLLLADKIKTGIKNECSIILFDKNHTDFSVIMQLKPCDLVIALFHFDTYVFGGANRFFSPFSKPDNMNAKYAFIRLGISEESLLQGLSTPEDLVYDTIEKFSRYEDKSMLRVTSVAGTDITIQTSSFTTCSNEIKEDGGMAFLPPSETSSQILGDHANGKIVIDVTIGQLYHFGKLLGDFGLVPSPVTITVQNGVITDIYGNMMAEELKSKLFALHGECRRLVEFSQGLSDMIPTGIIGVDESMIDTCHFGIGDGASCGVHLDVVIKNPQIMIVL